MNLLVIDNYDSFTYNLVQYFGELGASCDVLRNDQNILRILISVPYAGLVLSPGPVLLIRRESVCLRSSIGPGRKPLLGSLLRASMHWTGLWGKDCTGRKVNAWQNFSVHSYRKEIFAKLPNPFAATRYHSLVIEPNSLPDILEKTAWTDEQEIMAIRHRELPLWGVQFHPESLATDSGIMVLNNFLKYC